jgi:hypothetical protein
MEAESILVAASTESHLILYSRATLPTQLTGAAQAGGYLSRCGAPRGAVLSEGGGRPLRPAVCSSASTRGMSVRDILHQQEEARAWQSRPLAPV